jgi:hypothetical protein
LGRGGVFGDADPAAQPISRPPASVITPLLRGARQPGTQKPRRSRVVEKATPRGLRAFGYLVSLLDWIHAPNALSRVPRVRVFVDSVAPNARKDRSKLISQESQLRVR